MIIHSGRAPERRKASRRRSRLIAFLRRMPAVLRTSTASSFASASRSMRSMSSRTASAPMPARKMRAPRGRSLPNLASRVRELSSSSSRPISGSNWNAFRLSSAFFSLAISSLRLCADVLALARSAPTSPSASAFRSAFFCSPSLAIDSLSAVKFCSSSMEAWVSTARSRAFPSLPPSAPSATMISAVVSKTMAPSAFSSPRSLMARSVTCAASPIAWARSARSDSTCSSRARTSRSNSVSWRFSRALISLSSSAVAPPPRPASSSSRPFRASLRASSSTLVTMYCAK